jgi:hypothetical protein
VLKYESTKAAEEAASYTDPEPKIWAGSPDESTP